MLTIHSPQFSTSHKADILASKLSPTFRNKRIPSAQDNYSCSSNQNLKISKTQSPSKFSEEIRRRKSQYLDRSQGNKSRKEKNNSTQNIINSMHYLKEQYRSLKDAYRELIQQKVKNAEEMNRIKQQNIQLKADLQKNQKDNDKLKSNALFLQQENQRAKKQYIKLLQAEKFKAKKLEESLSEKQDYIKSLVFKIKSERVQLKDNSELQANTLQKSKENNDSVIIQESLTISQDKEKTLSNQSQFLSFSLTSMMQDSVYKHELSTRRRKQHLKVLSELTNINANNQQIKLTELKSNKNKDQSQGFKKIRKEISSKLEINVEAKQSKANLLHLNNLSLLPKTPIGCEQKKISKNKTSKSKRKEDDKQNTQIKNSKKKSKKLISLLGNQ